MTEKKPLTANVKALLAAKSILDDLKIKPFLIYDTLTAVIAKTLDARHVVQLGVKYEDIEGRPLEIGTAFIEAGFDVEPIFKPLKAVVRAWKVKHKETGVLIIIAAYFLFEDNTRKCPMSSGQESLSFDGALLDSMKNKNIGGRWFAAPTPNEDYLAQTYSENGIVKTEAFQAFKI